MNTYNLVGNFYRYFITDRSNIGELFTSDAIFVFSGDYDENWLLNGQSEINNQVQFKFNNNFRYDLIVKNKEILSVHNDSTVLIIKGLLRKISLMAYSQLESSRNFTQLFIQEIVDGKPLIKFTSMTYLAPSDEVPLDYTQWSKRNHQNLMNQSHKQYNDVTKMSLMHSIGVEMKSCSTQTDIEEQSIIDQIEASLVSDYYNFSPRKDLPLDVSEHSFPEQHESSIESEDAVGSGERDEYTLVSNKRNNKKVTPKKQSANASIDNYTVNGNNNYPFNTEQTLFVAGLLPRTANEPFLIETFSPFGPIKHVKVVTHDAGAYAFVYFRNKSSVNAVIQAAGPNHHFHIGDRYVIVDNFRKKLPDQF